MTEGYKSEAEGYAASLRQQADWWDREKDCLDSDELRAAADFIDRLPQSEVQSAVDPWCEEHGCQWHLYQSRYAAQAALPFLCPCCGARGTTDGKASTVASTLAQELHHPKHMGSLSPGWDAASGASQSSGTGEGKPDTPPAAQAPNEPVAFINRRLEDLAEANSLYGKDQRLNTPYKIARNNREISWLKDLRSLILIASSVPSAKSPVMQAAENASKIVEGWSNSKKEYADQVTRGSEVPSAQSNTPSTGE